MLQDCLTSTGNVGKNEGLGLGIPVEEMAFALWPSKDGEQAIITGASSVLLLLRYLLPLWSSGGQGHSRLNARLGKTWIPVGRVIMTRG